MTRTLPSVLVLAVALAGCGSRTDLGIVPLRDAGGMALTDSGPPIPDAAGPVDGRTPFDASSPTDAPVSRCGDGGAPTAAYVFDGEGILYRYDARTSTYTTLGAPGCESQVPWTMTVSRANAYILYTDWNLYAVDLTTLACSPTAFRSGQLGLDFQYGIAVAEIGGVEKLYVYGEPSAGNAPILATSDLSSFVLTKVGDILPAPPPSGYPVNLTADAFGHLFAYAPNGLLLELDATTGAVLQQVDTGITTTSTWATLTSGAQLFLFAANRVVGYDVGGQLATFEHTLGIDPIGAGSFLLCP